MNDILDIQHQQSVKAIAEKVRSFYDSKKPFRIYHGSTNSTRSQSFKAANMVDVRGLNRILVVDTTTKTATVEPNVPMDKLVAATLKYGLIPKVVMEFPGITVGGGLQGGAGESSSFKSGCFNRTLNWFEVILADGSVVIASPQDHVDLFYGSAGAYGSLGVVTAAQVQLVKAAKYVELEYLPVISAADAVETLKRVLSMDYDFIDGILYAKDRGVIIAGRLSDAPNGPVRRCLRARDQWFYLGVEKAVKGGNLAESYPLEDYLFRYDRGAFWTGRYVFERFGVPFSRLTRFLLNPLLKTRRMYIALDASGFSQEYIIQDLALPAASGSDFLNWVESELSIYPLWLCPLPPDKDSKLQFNHLDAEQIINVGVWGPGPTSQAAFVDVNRKLENKVRELGGRKWLYAHAYYPEDEFWQIYGVGWYQALREKYRAANLPSVYDKTHLNERRRVRISGKRGVWRAIVGSKRPS